jgi:AraC family transcriptional regulator of adaptative response/methylated-DNA-[protein]-cysteine methyltransferase
MHPLRPNQVSVAGSVEGDDLDDYQRIAAAIAFLRAHRVKQPDLAAVAQHLHLSESHVQRLFTCWAGISLKRFLQYLTVEYAKSKIVETGNLLPDSLPDYAKLCKLAGDLLCDPDFLGAIATG